MKHLHIGDENQSAELPTHTAGHQALTGSLEEGLTRLGDGHLWERWQWDSQGSLFTSATAFRQELICQCPESFGSFASSFIPCSTAMGSFSD